jgi:hypothetical protein
MRSLRDYVDDYVRQLSGPEADEAWHSLVEEAWLNTPLQPTSGAAQ